MPAKNDDAVFLLNHVIILRGQASLLHVIRGNPVERTVSVKVQIVVSPFAGLIEEALMQKWKITFVDDHGETVEEVFECDECPDNEHAAKLIKARLLPVAAELDLNDLEGRTADASVKSLKTQNSIEILGITPV